MEMVVHGGYHSETSSNITIYLNDTWHYTPPRTMFLYLKPSEDDTATSRHSPT